MRAIIRALRPASAEEVSQLGHQLERLHRTVGIATERLRSTPVTVAQHLGVDEVIVGINFEEVEKALAEAEAILAADPYVTFAFQGGAERMDSQVELLRGVMARAEPFRRFVQP